MRVFIFHTLLQIKEQCVLTPYSKIAKVVIMGLDKVPERSGLWPIFTDTALESEISGKWALLLQRR